jgi:putative colanic acid biosynthesis acetyltransferase WcaF
MSETVIDLAKYVDDFTRRDKIRRLLWCICDCLFIKLLGFPFFRKWRIFVLKCFGAKIEWSCTIYSSTLIWAPWNLEMGVYSCLGPKVDCYNQGKITIGANTIISQKCYLCASTHQHLDPKFPLILKPIIIGGQVWIAADAFIGPGVTIGEGAVVAARAAVFKNVKPWSVVGGNPAVFLKNRVIQK